MSLFLTEPCNVSWVLIIVSPIAIVMISGAIVVYGGSRILRIATVRIPIQWQNPLTLGGLRGGICVALALSLPKGYKFKTLFVALTFSLTVVNLVLNPIILDRYLKKSNMQ